jgi:hypothetical protein
MCLPPFSADEILAERLRDEERIEVAHFNEGATPEERLDALAKLTELRAKIRQLERRGAR